jgi:hypothetical protein
MFNRRCCIIRWCRAVAGCRNSSRGTCRPSGSIQRFPGGVGRAFNDRFRYRLQKLVVQGPVDGLTTFIGLPIGFGVPFAFRKVNSIGGQQTSLAEIQFGHSFVVFDDTSQIVLVSITTGDFGFEDASY